MAVADRQSAQRPEGPRNPRGLARSQARLAAVQALYQMDMTQAPLEAVIAEFRVLRFGPEAEVDDVSDADAEFFADLLRGVVRRQREIDPLIARHLAEGWRLTRIDSILRATLRAGVFELVERSDVPARVVITEYIEVARAFFDGDEPKVVNGLLDKIARDTRAAEFKSE